MEGGRHRCGTGGAKSRATVPRLVMGKLRSLGKVAVPAYASDGASLGQLGMDLRESDLWRGALGQLGCYVVLLDIFLWVDGAESMGSFAGIGSGLRM